MTDYDIYCDDVFFARYTTKAAAMNAAMDLANSCIKIYIISASSWNRINIKGY